MGKDWRWQIYVGFVADIDIKILGVPLPGAGHAFPRQQHMRRGWGGYLFMPRFFSLYDAIHGWMDGWKASQKTTTTSFTICNTPKIQCPSKGPAIYNHSVDIPFSFAKWHCDSNIAKGQHASDMVRLVGNFQLVEVTLIGWRVFQDCISYYSWNIIAILAN
jgi:hypothetical protein